MDLKNVPVENLSELIHLCETIQLPQNIVLK